jgi:hypothetical protein
MNTLEMTALYGVVFTQLAWVRIRAFSSAPRPRVLPALWLVYAVGMVAVSSGMFLFLATHPTDIQPISQFSPEWMVWTLSILAILYALVVTLRAVETIHHLALRFAHRR